MYRRKDIDLPLSSIHFPIDLLATRRQPHQLIYKYPATNCPRLSRYINPKSRLLMTDGHDYTEGCYEKSRVPRHAEHPIASRHATLTRVYPLASHWSDNSLIAL